MPGARVLAALVWVAFTACAEQRVPDALVDVWRTRAPGYEDRSFEVRPDSVVFGTGGHATTGHQLERVEVETLADGRIRCVLHYALHGGGAAELRVLLQLGPPATLRFENRKEPWYREKEAGWLAKREER